ncbi:MAG: Mn2+/Fe2+ NRAMP family transporter [Salibacteraceae bacterium]|jgi:Mn2+/Fe2+ NRAMP family transporter
MIFGTESKIPDGAGSFAISVIGMFTAFIGDWSYIIIAAAAFSIMFGTCIAVFDGYSRSIERSTALFLSRENEKSSVGIYNVSLSVIAIGSFSLVFFFGEHMKSLIDLAMTISFLIAPVIAVVNLRLVTGKYIDEEHKPKLWLKVLSWMGILFLTGFALYFAWIAFF